MNLLSTQAETSAHRWNLVCSATGMRSYGSAKGLYERTVPEMVPKLAQGGGRKPMTLLRAK